jgi:hypothetical protein
MSFMRIARKLRSIGYKSWQRRIQVSAIEHQSFQVWQLHQLHEKWDSSRC